MIYYIISDNSFSHEKCSIIILYTYLLDIGIDYQNQLVLFFKLLNVRNLLLRLTHNVVDVY